MSTTVKSVLKAGYSLEEKYIPDYEGLRHLVEAIKQAGFTVVLTQGVYDMFHVGHSRYLREAASFGDVLIVGVDSDELTRQMKGDDRPFDTFNDRVELLACLSFVKIITLRDVGCHMYDLIRLVGPDVLVMSKTTKSFTDEDKRALEEHCGRIEHLEPKAPPESVSTTVKILRLRREGAQELADQVSQAVTGVVENYLGKDSTDD